MKPPNSISPEINLNDVHLKLNSLAGEVHILRGINLSIFPGQVVGIIGASGSGKTSLLMVIAGLEPLTRGEISLNGQNLSSMTEDQLAVMRKNDFGIIFQNFHLVPSMTALENIALHLEIAGFNNAWETAKSYLDLVGLTSRAEHYPNQLSGGEQQRIAIARAFSTKPKVVLADEPTGSLDQKTGSEIINLIFRLQAEHKTTFVLVTHANALAERCDRIIRLADGKAITND